MTEVCWEIEIVKSLFAYKMIRANKQLHSEKVCLWNILVSARNKVLIT